MNDDPQRSQDYFFRHILPLMGSNDDRNETFHLVLDGLHQARTNRTLDEIIQYLIDTIGLAELLPPEYARFNPLLIHGMHFLLGQLPLERLAWKMVDQLQLAPEVSKGTRICTLIKDIPTLQKLGQVIGRNPNLDPSFKQALVSLEDNVNTITYADLHPYLQEQLRSVAATCHLEVEKTILSEASVCAVIPAKMISQACGNDCAVVLKMVKPAVRQNLPAELGMLDRLADYFERNKSKWQLGDLKFKDTFDRVRWMIVNEVDLTVEQSNLIRARKYYHDQDTIVVPLRMPCSTPAMTVMSRLDGHKITDVAHLTAEQKRKLASLLTDICIVKPFLDLQSETMFHGDPHAGNIAYRFNGPHVQIFLYDWGMMGRLNRLERYALGIMALGILTHTPRTILFAIDLVTAQSASKSKPADRDCYQTVARVLKCNQERRLGSMLTSVEQIFEELTYLGMPFPSDFIMFSKAMVTLNGVLSDIDPGFSRDDYVFQAILREFSTSIANMKLHYFLLKETWLFYRCGFERIIELQKFIMSTTARSGFARCLA